MLRFNMHTNMPQDHLITLQVFDDFVSVRWSTKFKVCFKLLKNGLMIIVYVKKVAVIASTKNER